MKPVILLSAILTFWTNFAIADAAIKYPVLTVTSQSQRNLTPWLGPGSIDARVIFAEQNDASSYALYICTGLDAKDCKLINESPVTTVGLTNLLNNGIGLNHWDLPIMMDLEWGYALPSTRDFINRAGRRLLEVIQARGQAEMISIHTVEAQTARLWRNKLCFTLVLNLKSKNL